MHKALGDTYALIAPYLVPTEDLTTRIACERWMQGHGCLYRIVDTPEPDGTFAAVCDENRCPTKFYTRKDLVRYTIGLQRIGLAVAECLGLHPQVEEIATDVLRIGSLPGSERPVPVLFMREKLEDVFERRLKKLFIGGMDNFLLLVPTMRRVSDGVRQVLARAEAEVLPMDEITEIREHEPVLTDAGQVRWQQMKATLGGPAVLGATFPTPPGAHWHDLTLVFRDGHTVSASIGAAHGIYTYKDMGMFRQDNQDPTAQWTLLRHFAEEMGLFTWDSRQADRRNQKRKERLAASLKAFFGIPDEPFAYRKEDGGWEAVFNVRTLH